MVEIYVYIIVALLPLSSIILVLQSNPYRVLIIRGILGAVAALVYALLGAADVALTEALMGTLLAITLYIVAVRSSMVVKLGTLESEAPETGETPVLPEDSPLGKLLLDLRRIFGKKYLRLEVVPYDRKDSLQQALMERELHAICVKSEIEENEKEVPPYQTTIRIQRLHEILQEEAPSGTVLKYLNTLATKSEQH